MRALLVLVLVLASVLVGRGSVTLAAQGPLALEPQRSEATPLAVATFEEVWRIVDERHFDPTLGGLDWDAVRAKFLPRVRATSSSSELRSVLREMLALLGQSHFAIVEAERLAGGALADEASPPGTFGFEVRERDGEALVVRVEPGGSAATAGVRPGWILEEADGTLVRETLGKATRGHLRPRTAGFKALQPLLGGAVGARAGFRFRDGRDAPRELALVAGARDAIPFDLTGLPRFHLTVRSERVERDGVVAGVLAFSNWFRPIRSAVDEALLAMRDCDGLVLDLRGNTGGEGPLACRVAAHFFAERTSLGTQRTRHGTQEYRVRPLRGATAFEGPLAILTDETTGSCSEIFTGGMQALGRARVFGERTAGAALPATLTELPNGDTLLHAIADFVTARGTSMEGAGVVPDERVPLTRAALLEGRDEPLEAALRWIARGRSAERRGPGGG